MFRTFLSLLVLALSGPLARPARPAPGDPPPFKVQIVAIWYTDTYHADAPILQFPPAADLPFTFDPDADTVLVELDDLQRPRTLTVYLPGSSPPIATSLPAHVWHTSDAAQAPILNLPYSSTIGGVGDWLGATYDPATAIVTIAVNP